MGSNLLPARDALSLHDVDAHKDDLDAVVAMTTRLLVLLGLAFAVVVGIIVVLAL